MDLDIVRNELSDIWIWVLSIYPQTRKSIVKKRKQLYSDFLQLLNYPKVRKNKDYEEKVKHTCKMLQSGFDYVDRIKELKTNTQLK